MVFLRNIAMKLKFMAAIITLLPVLVQANYTITPVKIHINPGSMISSLVIQNNNNSDRYFQVRIYALAKDGSNHELETKDLIVAPSMFNIKSKKSQMIRVAVKDVAAAFQHQHYMISIKELPHGEAEINSVKFVSDFRIPVFLGDDDVSATDNNSVIVKD